MWARWQSKSISRARSLRICAKRTSSSITRMLRAPARRGAAGATGAATGGNAGAEGAGATTGAAARAGAGAASGTAGSASGDGGTSFCGSTRVKTLPSPGVLCTWIDPPSSCARSREIDRPRPVPPYLRCVLPSAWRKASKISSCWCAGMPMPVSLTANDRVSSGLRDTCSATEPFSVNLSALDSRFFSTCARRCGSVSSVAGTSGATVAVSVRPFSCASGRSGSIRVCRALDSVTVSTDTVAWPASILDRSRMSLIRASRSLPAA